MKARFLLGSIVLCLPISSGFVSQLVQSTTFCRLYASTQPITGPIKSSDAFVREAFEEKDSQDFQKESDLLPPISSSKQNTEDPFHYDSIPFSLIVNQPWIKQALVIAAIDPSLSLLIVGPKGTGKSVLARSLAALLPEQKNAVTVPLHCLEDALLGTVDLERSLETGKAEFDPGLLATVADQGLLFVDDLQLLDTEVSHILWNSIERGRVLVEREGLSCQYDCHPLTIAAWNPEEGEEAIGVDRIAMVLPVQTEMTVEDRLEVVANVEAFVEKSVLYEKAVQEDAELRGSIQEARKLLPFVEPMTHDQLLYLATEATAADCEGQRGEIYAAKIATTSAALNQRTFVSAKDLQVGVALAIAPRARRAYAPDASPPEHQSQEEQQAVSQQQQPTMMDPSMQDKVPPEAPIEEEDMQGEETTKSKDTEEEMEEPQTETEEEPDDLLIPHHFMFGVDTSAALDPRLLQFQKDLTRRKGAGGKHSRIFNLQRGRFVKAVLQTASQGKIAVGATLRAAAPFQKARRRRHAHDAEQRLVYIDDQDIRIQRLKRKSGSLVLFVVDASGSMALNRMGVAKGAAIALLQEAYKGRDKVGLIDFHDDKASVLVPPTKSTALAKTRLEQLPCGGRSPLAHGMATALRTALSATKVKKDVGKVVIVLITDGRPTVPLCVSEGGALEGNLAPGDLTQDGQASRQYCRKEVYAIAKQMGAVLDIDVLVIDTEDKFVSTGVAKEIARLALGHYYSLDTVSRSADVAAIARQHVEHFR